MIIFKYKQRIIQYLFSSVLLLIIMLLLTKIFYKKIEYSNDEQVRTSVIDYTDNTTTIYVEYPRFNSNEKVNKIVTDNIYEYIRDFKTNLNNKELYIKYNLHYIDNFVNIEYYINNSLDTIRNYNVLIDLSRNDLGYITHLFDEEYLKNEIYSQVEKDYSTDLLNSIKKDTINNFSYIFNDDQIKVIFNNIEGKPSIAINYNDDDFHNDNNIHKHKYIAFTYDDGPGEYTRKLLNILNEYKSSATFFMLGNKMKYYDNVVNDIYNSNSEIGSHGYSHKDLSESKSDEIINEINTTNIIFNEITGGKIKLYRPAYGKYNDDMFSLGLQIVTWNIDPKDWLIKNSNTIYSNVIKNACDGCIVLMHDTYKETIEATEKLIPELNKLDYEVVSVSKLMEIKNYKIDTNKVLKEITNNK